MYFILCLIATCALFVYTLRAISLGAWLVLLPFIGGSFIGIISSLYIESGIFIYEQGVMSFQTGATARLIAVFFVFWIAFHVVSRAFCYEWGKNWQVRGHLAFPRLALSISVFMLVLVLFNILISETPPLFRDGYVSRFEYIQGTRLWAYISVFGVVTTSIPILAGFAFDCFRNNGKHLLAYVCISVLLVYMLYMVIIGHKFGGIVFGIFFFLLPAMVRDVHRLGIAKLFRRFAFPALITGFAIFALVYYHYSTYSLAEKFGGPLDFIIYRIFGLQAHVWWGLDQYVFVNGKDMFLNGGGLNDSMGTMMRIVGIPGVEDAIERGVNFTFGFPASAFLFFGVYIGFVVIILIAALTAIVVREIIVNISRYNLIGYFLSVYLLVWLFSILSLGTFETFVQVKFLAFIYGIIVYKIIMHISSKRIESHRVE